MKDYKISEIIQNCKNRMVNANWDNSHNCSDCEVKKLCNLNFTVYPSKWKIAKELESEQACEDCQEETRKQTVREMIKETKGCVEIAYFEGKIGIKARDYIYKLLSLTEEKQTEKTER